jgi:hypothetical protein
MQVSYNEPASAAELVLSDTILRCYSKPIAGSATAQRGAGDRAFHCRCWRKVAVQVATKVRQTCGYTLTRLITHVASSSSAARTKHAS